jgi:hypothetical protein
MSISTYAALVSAVTEYLARDQDTTLIARIPDFITLAEAKFNRELRVNMMETRSTTTISIATTEPEMISLPTDFQTMRRVRLSSVTGKPRLEFLSGAQADETRYGLANASGQPAYFTIFGSEMELIPTPDANYTIEMVYRANIPALTSTSTTNWLLTLAPDLYLYGTLLEAAPYLKDDDRIAVWTAGMSFALKGLNQLSQDQAYGSGPLVMRVSTQTAMTTWTPKTQQSETWTSEAPALHVFSTLVFSHAYSGSQRVFALGSANGGTEVWDAKTKQAETWTPE